MTDRGAKVLEWLQGQFPEWRPEEGSAAVWSSHTDGFTDADMRRGCEFVRQCGWHVPPTLAEFVAAAQGRPPAHGVQAEKKTPVDAPPTRTPRTDEQKAFTKRLLSKVGNGEPTDGTDYARAYRELAALGSMSKDLKLRRLMAAAQPKLIASVRAEMNGEKTD